MTTTVSPDAPPAPPASSADGVAWDLGDLYAGLDDPRIDQDLQAALQAPRRSRRRTAARSTSPAAPPPTCSPPPCTSWRACRSSATSRWSTPASRTPPRATTRSAAPCSSRTREQAVAVNQHLIFFDLEWVHLPDEAVEPLLDAPALARYRHYLDAEAGLAAALPQRAGREDPRREERSPAAPPSSGCSRRPSRPSSAPFKHDGKTETLSLQLTLAKLYDPDRKVRKAAAEGLTQGLAGQRPPADVHLQQPRPRPPDRLPAAAIRRPDGLAPPGQRDQAARWWRP